jgi:N-acetylglucosaminyldiphosphoundecaprenol N-acetyl-beta-D-mannosaminyltransferase
MTEAVDRGMELLGQEGAHYVVTPNPEIVEVCRENPEAMEAVNGADLVLADGIGVVKGAAMLGTPLKGRCPGIEFAAELMEKRAGEGLSLFLLGAKPGVAEEAGHRLLEQYPNITLCGTQDGYFQDEEDVLLKVAAARPDLLFVCLGAPKQEKWMARWGQHSGAKLAIGLGGVLDVYAGNVERAPESWQKLGLEWAYRLKKEPQRFGRMARLPLVLVKSAGQRLKGKGKA